MQLWLATLLSFLIGGIPFGFLAVKLLLGEDVRKLGSGNIGATNASRCFAGKRRWLAFAGIYVLDFLKGYLPVLLWAPGHAAWAGPLLAAAAVLGHCFSPYLGFKGGKGVATSGGAFFALEPQAVLIAIGAFVVVWGLTKVVALGSLALGFALAVAVLLREPTTAFGPRLWTSLLAIAVAAFLVWTHRSNIRGLLRLHQQRRDRQGA